MVKRGDAMNHRKSAHAKELVSFGHAVAYRSKLIDYHLLSISKLDKLNRERKIREIRQLLTEVINISDDLYCSGIDALKKCES